MDINLIFYILTFAFVIFSAMVMAHSDVSILFLIQISLLIFYNPASNKILVALTILHLVYLVVFKINNLLEVKGIVFLFLISILMLISGSVGLNNSSSMDSDSWGSIVLSPVVTGPLLAISIAAQLGKLNGVNNFFQVYAILRMIETAIIGILIYIYFQNELEVLKLILDGYSRIDFDETRRLISISSRNANEAAFLLLPAAMFFYAKIKENKYYKYFFYITLIAVVLTWTRSAIIIFLTYMLFSNAKLNRLGTQELALKIMLVTIFSSAFLIFSYLTNPDRLLTLETIEIRMIQYKEYIGAIDKINLMSGIIEDIWTKNYILNLTYNISSENVFIEFLYKYGLVVGGLIVLFYVFIFFRSIYGIATANKFSSIDPITGWNRKLIFFIYIVLFIMANTTSFEQVSILWTSGLLTLRFHPKSLGKNFNNA